MNGITIKNALSSTGHGVSHLDCSLLVRNLTYFIFLQIENSRYMDFGNYCAESFNSTYFKYHGLGSNKYAPACRHNKVFNLEQKVVELLNMKAAGCASLLWGKMKFCSGYLCQKMNKDIKAKCGPRQIKWISCILWFLFF